MRDLAVFDQLLESLRDIGLRQSAEDLLVRVLHQVEKLIRFDHGALLLLEPESGELAVRAAVGYEEVRDAVMKLRVPLGRGLTGWVAAHRSAVRVDDVSQDPRFLRTFESSRSCLIVPLLAGRELAGVIRLESEAEGAFSEMDEKLLTILGSQAALAIVALEANRSLRERIDELDALYRISQLASRRDDLDGTLQAIIQIAQEVIPCGNCAILLLGESERELKVKVAWGYPSGVVERCIPLGRGVTGRCAESGEVILVSDLGREIDYLPGLPGARSEIALPLAADGRIIGVLNAEAAVPNAYNEGHVPTLSVIAQQIAIVVRTAQLQDETRRHAMTDPLTGIFNRRHFVDALSESLERAKRYDERPAVIFLDLDHFKILNDLHGHQFGDWALQQVTQQLETCLRKSDILARLGGEEFAVLLPNCDEAAALALASRMREAVAGVSFHKKLGTEFRLTVSVGVAVYPRNGTDADMLLRRADEALYRAKREGRNRVCHAGLVAGGTLAF